MVWGSSAEPGGLYRKACLAKAVSSAEGGLLHGQAQVWPHLPLQRKAKDKAVLGPLGPGQLLAEGKDSGLGFTDNKDRYIT